MEEKNNISVKTNAFFNVLKTAVGLMAPLITYTYISRILGAENLGKINFIISVISYFQLIASLGISNYAISEGAKRRNNNDSFTTFCSEILLINVVSTISSYFLLLACVLLIPALRLYEDILFIVSLTIFFNMLGMEWLYGAIENYRYISIRAIIFQVLNVILVLMLVKNKDDVQRYVYIYILPVVLTGIVNFFYRKKYVKLLFKHISNDNIKRHLKPILTIWGMSIASVIYINSDTIMLVLMQGDKIGGVYSVAVKSSHVCCLVWASVSAVLLPRFSKYIADEDMVSFQTFYKKSFITLCFFITPLFFVLFTMSRESVLLLGGSEYEKGELAARIISFNLLLSPINGFITSQVFIPLKKEKTSLIATIIGAFLNVTLNFILIPAFSLNGAATTTIISELTVLIICLYSMKTETRIPFPIRDCVRYFVASIPIPIIYLIVFRLFNFGLLISCVITIICSIIAFCTVLYLYQDNVLKEVLTILHKKKKIGGSE